MKTETERSAMKHRESINPFVATVLVEKLTAMTMGRIFR